MHEGLAPFPFARAGQSGFKLNSDKSLCVSGPDR